MKKLLAVTLSVLTVLSLAVISNSNANAGTQTSTAAAKKRGPIFRATKEQIKQAQVILKTRGFYSGDPTAKLDAATREGLRGFQKAEGLTVTGTMNKLTLEKMGIELTDKQRAM